MKANCNLQLICQLKIYEKYRNTALSYALFNDKIAFKANVRIFNGNGIRSSSFVENEVCNQFGTKSI